MVLVAVEAATAVELASQAVSSSGLPSGCFFPWHRHLVLPSGMTLGPAVLSGPRCYQSWWRRRQRRLARQQAARPGDVPAAVKQSVNKIIWNEETFFIRVTLAYRYLPVIAR